MFVHSSTICFGAATPPHPRNIHGVNANEAHGSIFLNNFLSKIHLLKTAISRIWVSPVPAFAIIFPRNVLDRVGSQSGRSLPIGSATVLRSICHYSVVRAGFNVLSCWSATGRLTITQTVPSLTTCVNA